MKDKLYLFRAGAPSGEKTLLYLQGIFFLVPFLCFVIILPQNESHFLGPKHAQKLMKFGRPLRPGEKVFWVPCISGKK